MNCLPPLPLFWCVGVFYQVRSHSNAYPFNAPVRPEIAPTYADVIKNPMDLATLRELVANDQLTKAEELFTNLQLIWSNSYLFNNAKTKYYTMARNMEVHSIMSCKVHTRTNTHAHTYTHTNTHTHEHAHTNTHKHTHKHTLKIHT